MDVSETLAPTSDQLDAVELVNPRTFTIASVKPGSTEQPVDVALEGFPRVWRPSKGMRRVLAAGWGVEASKWAGRRVRLFCDPDVMFGREKVGGIRISHMSDLPGNKRLSVPLLVSRGKSALWHVDPLPDAPPPVDIAACTDPDVLRGMWRNADPSTREQIRARVDELTGGAA